MIDRNQDAVKKADIVIIGAGTAGIPAAIAAGRRGYSVLVVEREKECGGTGAFLGVNIWMPYWPSMEPGRKWRSGIFGEFVDELTRRGALHHDMAYSPEQFREVSRELMRKAGVELWTDAAVTGVAAAGGRIKNIVVDRRRSKTVVEGALFIDASGDAVLTHMAGFPTSYGRDLDNSCQPASLMFALGPVDTRAAFEFGRKCEDAHASIDDKDRIIMGGFDSLIARCRKKGELSFARRTISVVWSDPVHPETVYVNATRLTDVNPFIKESMTAAYNSGILQSRELEKFFRKYIPGFEKAVVSWTAPEVGLRESRRIIGEYVLTEDDLIKGKTFPDGIARCGYQIDIHDPHGDDTRLRQLPPGGFYEIPYRSMLPVGSKNIIVAGRCISGTHEAMSSYRVQPPCIWMGEAAGTAAAMAIEQGVSPSGIDFKELSRLMLGERAKAPKAVGALR